jgi:hypothetical protein
MPTVEKELAQDEALFLEMKFETPPDEFMANLENARRGPLLDFSDG